MPELIKVCRVPERRDAHQTQDGRAYWKARSSSIETVKRALIGENQPLTVDIREFIKILALRGFHLSEFLEPKGPHGPVAQITEVTGCI